MMQVNVNSALYGIQEVLPHMKQRGSGQIINVSSIVGRNAEAFPMGSAYSASKHFLNAMTCALRAEHREAFPNIKFQTFSPGPVITEFMGPAGIPTDLPWMQDFLRAAQTSEDCALALLRESIQGKKEEAYSRDEYKKAQVDYFTSLIGV